MDRCPDCSARLWPTVFRRRDDEDSPQFAAARWACNTCGWSSPTGALDLDEPDQIQSPARSVEGPDRPTAVAPIRVAVISRNHIVRTGLVNLIAQLGSRTVVTEATSVDEHLEPHDVAIYDLGAVADIDVYKQLRRRLEDGVQVIGLVYDVDRATLAPVVDATSHVITLSATAHQLLEVLQQTTPAHRVLNPHSGADRLPAGISEQEFRTLELIGAGLSNEDIAKGLHVSVNTVKTYIRMAYRKIEVSDRSGAMRWAMEHGLVGSTDQRRPRKRSSLPALDQ